MIVEMAGQPPEYVKERLEQHVGVLQTFKDVEVHSIHVSEPKEVEKGKNFFTCFAEVDFEAERFSRISDIMFDFMPSSVEVVEPSKVNLDASEASNLLNNISGRMHRYDQAAMMLKGKLQQTEKQLIISNQLLLKNGIVEMKDDKLILSSNQKGTEKEEGKITDKKEKRVFGKKVKKKSKR